MGDENVLIKGFKHRGLVFNGDLYLEMSDSFEFIQACSHLQIAVLGIDFFKINNNIIVPVIPVKDIDCSCFVNKNKEWKEIVRSCNEYSVNCLIHEYAFDQGLYCNFCLLEEEEFAT